MTTPQANPKKTPPKKAAAAPTGQIVPARKYRVLFADNEETFLNEIPRLNRETPDSALECLTLHLPETAGAGALFDLLCETLKKDRPDLLLMDINLLGASGTDGMALVKRLRELACPYPEDLSTLPLRDEADIEERQHPWLSLPVVLMTQDREADAQARLEAVGEHVEAVIFGKKQETWLLRLVETSLPSWRELARERLWSQLERRLAGWLADRSKHHADTALRTLLFLHGHLGMANCFVRLDEPDKPGTLDIVARVRGNWAEGKPSLSIADVPVLGDVLLAADGIRHDKLPKDRAGTHIPEIAGRPMLGARLWYADAAIGLITVVGDEGDAPYTRRDLDHLLTVANSLAAVCGRANRQKLMQIQAHDYADALARCGDEKAVAEVLANTAQEALQKRGHEEISRKKHKTSVRLLEPGSYILRRQICLADEACIPDADIDLNEQRSIYAWVVREGKPELLPDAQKDERFLKVCPWVNAELCVPLLYGGVALGAVNLEHETRRYYDHMDERQLGILASQAALAISRLREHRFANALLDWATEAERLISPAEIWPKIYASLFEYCGYGCLLHCIPPEQPGQPWPVRKVYVHDRLQAVSRDAEAWSKEITEDWNNEATFLRRWLREGRLEVELQRDPGSFSPVSNQRLLPYAEKADAIIPLPAGGEMRGLLLLFWFHAPPWSEQDQSMLARLGRYGGELMAREGRVAVEQRERHELEDLALFGEVLRQFKHLYRNARGGLNNWGEYILAQTEVLRKAGADTTRLRQGMEKLIAAIHDMPPIERIAAYMHEPKPAAISPLAAWGRVAAELQAKAERIGAEVAAPKADLQVLADPVILELILYMLLDNALDALVAVEAPRRVGLELVYLGEKAVLAVQDNGPGVAASMRASLFEKIDTSKPGGLGSALYIARLRARAMKGDLRLAGCDAGARFELELPRVEGIPA